MANSPRGERKKENTETILVNKSPASFLANTEQPSTDKLLNAYEMKTRPELVRFYHAAAGFPTKPTWIAAINNKHYVSWVGLDASSVATHFPESEEMWKGHGRKIKSGLRSTKTAIASETDGQLATNNIQKKERCIFTQMYDLHDDLELKMYTNQTGCFPVRSYRGNQYIMVLIELDSNSILVEAMQNRTSGEMVRAYQTLVDRLKESGIEPKMHVLDNECSNEFKRQIKTNHMKYQLVPPHDHRQNIAEKSGADVQGSLCGRLVRYGR